MPLKQPLSANFDESKTHLAHQNNQCSENNRTDYDSSIFRKNFLGNNINFGTLRRNNSRTLAEDTGFFRDLTTLNSAVEILKTNFPDGAEILDYACSDGEESISLLALLGKDKKKFDIKAFDTSRKMISRAKKADYSIFTGYWDDFLFHPSSVLDKDKRQAMLAFYNMMRKDKTSEYLAKNLQSPQYYKQAFYTLKDKYKGDIEYNEGSIENIDMLNAEKPVGAVFFRNAFYHVFRPEDGNEYNYKEMSSLEKIEKADEIIDKIDNVLEPGGIFVMGNIPAEHIFAADETIPDSEKTKLLDLYNDVYLDIPKLEDDLYVFNTSPIAKALQERGYEPVCTSKCRIGEDLKSLKPVEIDVPTVWKKPYSKSAAN